MFQNEVVMKICKMGNTHCTFYILFTNTIFSANITFDD